MRSRLLRLPLPSRPSWWLEEARAHEARTLSAPLAGRLETDVAILGAGDTRLRVGTRLLDDLAAQARARIHHGASYSGNGVGPSRLGGRPAAAALPRLLRLPIGTR